MLSDAEMRQRLLELVYGLLPDPDAAQVRAEIERDPKLAGVYAEVQETARLLAEAARVKSPRIRLHRSERARHSAGGAGEKAGLGSNGAHASYWSRGAGWVVGLATVALLVVSVGGYIHQKGRLSDIAREHLRLVVTGPSRLQAGASHTYNVLTRDVADKPVSAQIELALYSPAGKELFRQKEQTDRNGRLLMTIPGDVNLPSGARLELQAAYQEKIERIETRLEVEPTRYRTQLVLDRQAYRPGDTVFYRSLTLTRFGLAAERDVSVQFEILDPAGKAVEGSSLVGLTRRGVGCGAFAIPERLPPGRYTLVARSLDKSFPEDRRTFAIAPAQAPQAPSAAASAEAPPAGPPTVHMVFCPEGGDLVAGMQNRVYFQAWDDAGQPVAVRGTVLDREGKAVAEAEAAYQGMGAFTLLPGKGQQYRLKIAGPAGIDQQPLLPAVASEHDAALAALAPAVFDVGEPLRVTIRAAKAGLPLVVAAACRGVPVGQTALLTAAGDNPLAIPLPAEVGGVIRLTLYDYHRTGPVPLAERLVYRKPGRTLQIRVGEHAPRYAPGERVSLSVTANNEQGEPVPAILGLAVVDEASLGPAAAGPPTAAVYFLLAGDLPDAQGLEQADFCLSDDPQAPAALDLLLGTLGWRRFVHAGAESPPSVRASASDDDLPPPAMFDNLDQISAKYAASLQAMHAEQTSVLKTLTIVSFFGGFGLVLFVAMLTLLRIISGLRLWLPALGAALCSLAIGTLLMNPDRLQPEQGHAVPFAPFTLAPGDRGVPLAPATERAPHAPADQAARGAAGRDWPALPAPPAAAREPAPPERRGADEAQSSRFTVRAYAHYHPATTPAAAADRTQTLFWHPSLVAGTNGRAQFEFELPDSLTTFRLRVDGHAAGRVGTARDAIVARLPLRLDLKLPGQITVGDEIRAPLEIVNETGRTLALEAALEHLPPITVEGEAVRKLELASDQAQREWFVVRAEAPGSEVPLTLRLTGERVNEVLRRRLTAVAPGYPIGRSSAGRLSGESRLVIDLPERSVPGSLEATLTVLASPLAEIEQAIAGMLRQPALGLEQVVSANYLHVLALKWLADSGTSDPQTAPRAREFLQDVPARLAPFQTPDQGYDLFGHGPGQETLTAYALLQLRAMAKACDTAPASADRAAAWLLARRDGHGGFRLVKIRGPGNPPLRNDLVAAYVTWALVQAGQEGIDAEVKHLARLGRESDEPYVVALAAGSVGDAGSAADGEKLLAKLAGWQRNDGHLEGNPGSITPSGDRWLAVQTTALAAMAWLKSPAHAAQAERALDWLSTQRSGDGSFGSPQATVLALAAIVEHARRAHRGARQGQLAVRQDTPNGDVIVQRGVTPGAQEPIVVNLEGKLRPGQNHVVVALNEGNQMPYTLEIAYRVAESPAAAECPLRLTSRLSARTVELGGSVTLSAELANLSDAMQPMTVARLRLPGGLAPRSEQLAELKRSGTFDQYEVRPGEVVLCWAGLAPKKNVPIRLDLTAAIPGRYQGEPSQAYRAYHAEQPCWAGPLAIQVTAKQDGK